MGVASLGVSGSLRSAGVAGLVWTKNIELGVRQQWAHENGLAVYGGNEDLPSYQRSFGKVLVQRDEDPFAAHCFRAPSEWSAEFVRNEFLFAEYVNMKLVRLR